MILGQVVGGLLALWCLYHLYGCWQYKVRKVKFDKKRVREMVAQDLPAKPRYPIFSAVASLCYAMDIEETEAPQISTTTPLPTAVTVTVGTGGNNNTPTQHHYSGQGAYMDGPDTFIDLEANLPRRNNTISGISSSSEKRKRRKRGERKRRRDREQLVNSLTGQQTPDATVSEEKPMVIVDTDPKQGEVSDLSEASSASEESTDASANPSDNTASSNNDEEGSVRGSSNHSYATPGWYELEPSDDSDVVYSLSSDDENNI